MHAFPAGSFINLQAAHLLAGSAPNRVVSSVSSQHLATSSKAAWSPGPETKGKGNL